MIPYESTCFHAHLYVEKAIEQKILNLGEHPKKTHDLPVLMIHMAGLAGIPGMTTCSRTS